MSKNIQVSLSPERVSLSPGETAEFVATVHNSSDVVEAYSIDVQGVNTEWSKLSVTSVSLFPGDKENIRIQITPPISSAAKAGSYAVSVRVISKRDPAIGTIASFILDLGKMAGYDLDLSPKKTRGRKGPFQLAITNNGNITSTYKLEGNDPEDLCDFRFKSDTVAVDAGTTKKTSFMVNPKKKPFTGAARQFSFTVKATPLDGEAKEVDGEFECRPLLPRWAVAAIILGVVALIAVIVVLIMSGGGVDLPLNQKLNLGAGKYKAYEFKESTGTIQANVTWTGADALSLVLSGPDKADRDRLDGSSPLSISYVITDNDLASGKKWVLYVANLSDTKSADATVHLTYLK